MTRARGAGGDGEGHPAGSFQLAAAHDRVIDQSRRCGGVAHGVRAVPLASVGGGGNAPCSRASSSRILRRTAAGCRQFALEFVELTGPVADQFELALDVTQSLQQQLATALGLDVLAA